MSSKPIVIKIGTSTLTGRNKGEAINLELLEKLAQTVCEIEKDLNKKCILVSSGAMGLGINKLGLEDKHDVYEDVLDFKAAITAIGQVELINTYEKVFKKHGKHVGQILITDYALNEPSRQSRVKKSIKQLFELDVLPIFNENDTVCPDEIEFGDNDRLSASVAKLVSAERLIILTDCNGLYDSDPHKNPDAKLIPTVNKITEEIKKIAGDSSTYVGLGGMKSKIMAAGICLDAGIAMNILNKDFLESMKDLILDSSEKPLNTEFKA